MTKYDASNNDNVTIYKVNVEEAPKLAQKFSIRAVPITVYLKNGKEVNRERGIKTASEIKSSVDKYFK